MINPAPSFLLCFFLLVGLCAAGGQSADERDQRETPADRRLLSIIEHEQRLQQRAEEGASEETLLLMAQEIADRYERFLADNPNHPYGWILAGRFLRSIGNDPLALAAFLRADQNTPGQAAVQQQIGQILAESGDYELALPYLLQAVEISPDEPTYHQDLGLFLMTHGTFLEQDGVLTKGRSRTLANEAFSQARKLDPNNFDRWWQWAESFSDLSEPDWEGSVSAWEETLKHTSSTIQQEAVWLQLARSNLKLGNWKDAEKWLDKEITTPALQANWKKLREQYEASTFR